jgi:ATP-dependent Clp protease ATP-binding subunit ClpC
MTTDFFEENTKQAQKKKTNSTTPILDNFSRDLVKLAEEGKIDPVIGREKEIKRIAQILSRKRKNNLIIVGESGSGKSALVDKLALQIYKGECPSNLLDKRLLSLDLTSLVAGTKYRGQFEERIKAILIELQENPNVIIAIDEFHTLVGAGNAVGSMDAANILKPALARGEIQCIGMTTFDEYKKSIEKDGALARRFQKIILTEPSIPETILILENLKPIYEDFHKVKYEDNVIETIVNLSARYITNRFFPDKAIDVIDELGSEKKISIKIPETIDQLKKEMDEIHSEKIQVVQKQDYEKAVLLKNKEKELQEKLEKEKQRWSEQQKSYKIPVTISDVYSMISIMTNIPISEIDESETNKLLHLEELLGKSVIGQKDAISIVSKAIRRNRVGIKEGNRPIASFIFNGISGSGKTYLAKQLAKEIFGSENSLVRIDMSEYQEKYSASKFIGTGAGYIGYEDGGILTEKIKNHPYSVILFDEVEKAHVDIFNLLLQILDEGHLTDGHGVKVDFKNTLIILTSNLGVKHSQEFGGGIGFSNSTKNIELIRKDILMKEMKKFFLPEFLNRVDDIVIFNQLTNDDIREISKLELKKLTDRLEQIDYLIEYDESLIEFIAKIGYESIYGARPIKRAIQEHVEDFLSDQILMNKIEKNHKYVLKYSDDMVKIEKNNKKKSK